MLAASVAQFGLVLRDSEYKGNANFNNTLALAEKAKGEDKNGYREDFIQLIELADMINKKSAQLTE